MVSAWSLRLMLLFILIHNLADGFRLKLSAGETSSEVGASIGLNEAQTAQQSLQAIFSPSSSYKCKFNGKDYLPDMLCTRLRGAERDEEDCGFQRVAHYLSGNGCESYCTAMRAVLARAPNVPCESIEPAIRVMMQPNPFDCKFKSKPYAIENVCARVKGQYHDDESCGFEKAKASITGPDCRLLCSNVREAIVNEPESACDIIAWHVHANAEKALAEKNQDEVKSEILPNVGKLPPAKPVELPLGRPVEGRSSEKSSVKSEPPSIDEVRTRCTNVWVIVEGDNSNGLNIRMGSEQYRRLMTEDLGWDSRCAIVLTNNEENTNFGEFNMCKTAICMRSSTVYFNTLPTTLGSKFPSTEKVFLLFNDHGDKMSGLVFPGHRMLKRSLFLGTIQGILELSSVKSMFVLVDACFSGSMFGDPIVHMTDAAGQNATIRSSHGGDEKTDTADLLQTIGEEVGKPVMGFASSIPHLSCMESGMRGGLFTWSYMNALDSLLARYIDAGTDFTFKDIIDSTWEQMPPLLPRDVEPITISYVDPATQSRRTQQQPASVRTRSQTYFPMSYGTMSEMSAAEFFCGSSVCDMMTRNPPSSRCETSTVNSSTACIDLNHLPDEDPRGVAPLTKQCQWSDEYNVCLPWVKAHAYVEKFKSSSRNVGVVRCTGSSCKLG